MTLASQSMLSDILRQAPFPNGWVIWQDCEPEFLTGGPGFPLEDYCRARMGGVRYPMCLIDVSDPTADHFDHACELRRLDDEMVIVAGVPAAGLHATDADRAEGERLLLVDRDGGRERLEQNLRVLLSDQARHRGRDRRMLRRNSGRTAVGTDIAVLADAANVMLMVMDESGRILHINEPVGKRLGFTLEEARGMQAVEFHPAPFREEAARVVGEMLGGKTDRCMLPLMTRTGEWVSAEIRMLPGRWQGRRVLFAVVKDLTESAGFQSHFQAVFQHAGLCMAMIRIKDRTLVEVNRGFERRVAGENVTGKRLGQLTSVTNLVVLEALVDEVQAGRTVSERELPMVSGAGKPTMMLVSATPINLGGEAGALFVGLDITERHEANNRVASTLTALEAGAEGIAITDANGVFTYMNTAHATLFGYDEPDEVVGRSWRILYRPEEVRTIERDVFPQLAEKGFWRGRLPGIRKDGTTVYQEMRLTLTPDHGIVCFTNDATEVAQGLRQRERLLAHTNSLWVICDFSGHVAQFNDVWLDLLGVRREDILAKTVFDFVHPEDAEAMAGEFELLRSGGTVANFVVRMCGSAGQVHWLDWYAIASLEDGLVYATAHDITRNRLAELALMDNLASIRGLAQMKADFLSMASHELRTPLANIALGAGLIHTHIDFLAPEERANILDGIAAGVTHMTRLLDDLLVSARLQQFHLSIRPEVLDIAGFLDVTIASLEPDHRPRVVQRLDLDSPVIVADRSLLGYILLNLLSNACKYSPGGQPVELEIRLANQELTIQVLDRGIGIPPDQVALVFDGFFRGNNVGRIGGTGLGLFIVSQCVSMLGGVVTCSNRTGGGAAFTVRLSGMKDEESMMNPSRKSSDPVLTRHVDPSTG